jgi:hypothetical protein
MKRLLLASAIFFTSPTFCQTKAGKVDKELGTKLQIISSTISNLTLTAKEKRVAVVSPTANNSLYVAPKGRRILNFSAKEKMKAAITSVKY